MILCSRRIEVSYPTFSRGRAIESSIGIREMRHIWSRISLIYTRILPSYWQHVQHDGRLQEGKQYDTSKYNSISKSGTPIAQSIIIPILLPASLRFALALAIAVGPVAP